MIAGPASVASCCGPTDEEPAATSVWPPNSRFPKKTSFAPFVFARPLRSSISIASGTNHPWSEGHERRCFLAASLIACGLRGLQPRDAGFANDVRTPGMPNAESRAR